LIYHSSGTRGGGILVAVDSLGREQQFGKPRLGFGAPRVSPDGKHVASQMRTSGRHTDIWVLDVATGALSRLTSDSSSERPEWSRDGTQLIFHRMHGDSSMIVARPWDGSGTDSIMLSRHRGDSTSAEEMAVGPAHGYTILRTGGSSPYIHRDLHIAPTDNLQAMRDFVVTRGLQSSPSMAPSGDAVAYQSEETGRNEVYVRPIPGPGAPVQVSAEGGEQPVWARDGRTLYYRTAARTLVAATIRLKPTIGVVGNRRVLFTDVYQGAAYHAGYDAMPDGRLLFVKGRAAESKVTVEIDWMRLMKGAK
jgi:eukaryotic-like serine/threonine-protein kinase